MMIVERILTATACLGLPVVLERKCYTSVCFAEVMALSDLLLLTQVDAPIPSDVSLPSGPAVTSWFRNYRNPNLWYFRSAVFADRYRASKPLRVLTVTTSAERLANMKRVTEEAGGQTWFWFSTYAALADPADILHRPSWSMAGRQEPVTFPYPLLGDPKQ